MQRELKEKEGLQMNCFVFIVLYFIVGCYSCYSLFSALDIYIDRKTIEDCSLNGSLQHEYDTIFYSTLTHFICSMWLPVCYVFNFYQKFVTFLRVIIILVPVQLFTGATALFIGAGVLPFFSKQPDQFEYVIGFAILEMFLISGQPVLLVLAFLMNDPPEKLTELELLKEINWESERKKGKMEKARKRANELIENRGADVIVQ